MQGARSHTVRRNAILLVCVALIWTAADQLTKNYFDSWFAVGQHMGGPFLGLFQFTLVHNQGAAWGMFSGSMVPLGIFSLFVCGVILVYLFRFAPDSSLLETLGLALVFSGGIGNAIDRFGTGYVVDFIDVTFMDFPVFNIADIGVTCGIVLFLLGFAVFGAKREKEKEEREELAVQAGKGESSSASPVGNASENSTRADVDDKRKGAF